jgi:hypothetical protein
VRERRPGTLTGALGGAWSMATGNVADPSSTAAQLLWVREHEPDTLRRATQVLLGAPGYLPHRAAGRASCDLTTASTTGLLDIHRRTWWTPVLEVLGLDPGLLPELVDGLSEVGELSRTAAEELELPAGLPLVHAAADAASVTAGLIGATPGAISVSLGTSGWVAALTGRPSGPNEAIHHLVGPTGPESLLIGALLSAGATVEWARRTYLPGASRSAAEQTGPTELLMLPSLAGERAPVRGPAGAYRAAAGALGLPVPAPLADAVDPVTVLHPGGQREHYDRLADRTANSGRCCGPPPGTGGPVGGADGGRRGGRGRCFWGANNERSQRSDEGCLCRRRTGRALLRHPGQAAGSVRRGVRAGAQPGRGHLRVGRDVLRRRAGQPLRRRPGERGADPR